MSGLLIKLRGRSSVALDCYRFTLANSMKRLIKSRGRFTVIVVFGLVFTLSILISILPGSPRLASIPTTPHPVGIDSQDPVILTVENQDGGMVCNTDKYLRLRVYLSGRIEGDSFDHTKTCHRERKTAMLDDVRLANLRRALERRDLLKCENQYPQFAIHTDTYTHSRMTFKIEQEEKSIALTNPESADPSNIANYPKALMALLREIDEIIEHFEFS